MIKSFLAIWSFLTTCGWSFFILSKTPFLSLCVEAVCGMLICVSTH